MFFIDLILLLLLVFVIGILFGALIINDAAIYCFIDKEQSKLKSLWEFLEIKLYE